VFRSSATAHADPNELAKTAAIDFARRLVSLWQATFGTELLGAYLIGSMAHAGFSRRYSDVDMALVTATSLPPGVHDDLRSQAIALSADWGSRISIFWADRHFSIGRFPPLDRIDYLDHALLLMERERIRPTRPTLTDVREYLRGAPLTSWVDRARGFMAAERLDPRDRKAYLRTLLYPARFCFSWTTGRMGSNDDAVAFVNERPPAQLDVSLIKRALELRRDAADPDVLFCARTVLMSQIDACVTLIRDESSLARPSSMDFPDGH